MLILIAFDRVTDYKLTIQFGVIIVYKIHSDIGVKDTLKTIVQFPFKVV